MKETNFTHDVCLDFKQGFISVLIKCWCVSEHNVSQTSGLIFTLSLQDINVTDDLLESVQFKQWCTDV